MHLQETAQASQPIGIRELDVFSVQAHGREYRLVDVRDMSSYTGPLGHVEGAELIPISALEQLAQSWPTNESIVTCCRDGKLAMEAAKMLHDMGYERVSVMRGGMEEWHKANLPISRRIH